MFDLPLNKFAAVMLAVGFVVSVLLLFVGGWPVSHGALSGCALVTALWLWMA